MCERLTEWVDDEASVRVGVEAVRKHVGYNQLWRAHPGQYVNGHPHNHCYEHCKVADDSASLKGKEGIYMYIHVDTYTLYVHVHVYTGLQHSTLPRAVATTHNCGEETAPSKPLQVER